MGLDLLRQQAKWKDTLGEMRAVISGLVQEVSCTKWWSRISDWGKKGIDTSVKLLHMATFPCVKLSLFLVSSVLLHGAHCLLVVYHSTDCLTDSVLLRLAYLYSW